MVFVGSMSHSFSPFQAVVDVVNTLVGDLAAIPLLSGLLGGLDGAIATLLSELELLVAGLLTVVATLYVIRLDYSGVYRTEQVPLSRLVNVAGLLADLAFDLTLAALGL